MFPYLILGLAVLVGGVLLARWFVNAEPRHVARVVRWLLIILGTIFVLVMVFAGRQVWAALLLPMLLPLIRSRGLWQRIKAARGPSSGQKSEVATRYLRMVLDHDSGSMTGEVIDGQFQGWSLHDMSLDQLLDLWRECAANDAQSAAVLEAYLDRAHGDAWREAAGYTGAGTGGGQGAGPGGRGPMTREEAYRILGLEEGAKETEIRDAHRRLMQKMHPDHGGSNYLAAKINEAKSVLLGE